MSAPNTNARPVKIEYHERRIIYICPKCEQPLVFRRKTPGNSLCIQCGQRLDWEPLNQIRTEIVVAENATDAAIIAEKYYKACNTPESEQFDLNEFRKSLIEWDPKKPAKKTELYLYFKNPQEYGRFKRSR